MGLRNRKKFNDQQIFFITTTCYQWLPLIDRSGSYNIIEESLSFCIDKYNAAILGYVIMPNHLHLILYFSHGQDRIGFMRDFKKYTSVKIRSRLIDCGSTLLDKIIYVKKRQMYKVWQDRFDEVYLKDRSKLETKLTYIHENPLQEKWSLVKLPEDYHYSSAAYYEKGLQPDIIDVTHYMDFL